MWEEQGIFMRTIGFKNDIYKGSTSKFHHKSTSTLVLSLTVSHNRALSHWYSH